VDINDLIYKIGVLTIENDMLRAELNRAAERIKELEGLIPQTEEPEGSKEK
jgi:hypothetical protein